MGVTPLAVFFLLPLHQILFSQVLEASSPSLTSQRTTTTRSIKHLVATLNPLISLTWHRNQVKFPWYVRRRWRWQKKQLRRVWWRQRCKCWWWWWRSWREQRRRHGCCFCIKFICLSLTQFPVYPVRLLLLWFYLLFALYVSTNFSRTGSGFFL